MGFLETSPALDAIVDHLGLAEQVPHPAAVSAAAIRAAVQELPFAPAPAVIALYQRLAIGPDRLELMPGFELLSLANALDQYWHRRRGGRWGHAWLPVLISAEGDCLAIDHTGQLDEVLLVEPCGSASRERVSFDEWLAGLAAAYESGLFDDGHPGLAF